LETICLDKKKELQNRDLSFPSVHFYLKFFVPFFRRQKYIFQFGILSFTREDAPYAVVSSNRKL
jgi:hypothetical protein